MILMMSLSEMLRTPHRIAQLALRCNCYLTHSRSPKGASISSSRRHKREALAGALGIAHRTVGSYMPEPQGMAKSVPPSPKLELGFGEYPHRETDREPSILSKQVVGLKARFQSATINILIVINIPKMA
jgi:hypothetical protein